MENNRYLLDTHILIWWMSKNSKLSEKISNILRNPHNQLFISTASIWEIIIKRAKKRLKVPQDIEKALKTSGFQLLPMQLSHVLKIETLPPIHHDPFDRMLIAQSNVENLTLITSDQKFWQYKLNLLKA